MAEFKISELTAVDAVSTDDVMILNDTSGSDPVTKSATISQLATAIGSGSGSGLGALYDSFGSVEDVDLSGKRQSNSDNASNNDNDSVNADDPFDVRGVPLSSTLTRTFALPAGTQSVIIIVACRDAFKTNALTTDATGDAGCQEVVRRRFTFNGVDQGTDPTFAFRIGGYAVRAETDTNRFNYYHNTTVYNLAASEGDFVVTCSAKAIRYWDEEITSDFADLVVIPSTSPVGLERDVPTSYGMDDDDNLSISDINAQLGTMMRDTMMRQANIANTFIQDPSTSAEDQTSLRVIVDNIKLLNEDTGTATSIAAKLRGYRQDIIDVVGDYKFPFEDESRQIITL
tara:strand:- start:369 stop:1397 length:1029 start_codon:yes stop_codon:yes gene_type:complete